MERQFAARRRGVDILGERMQFDTTLMEQGHGVDKLAERTRQAVQLPDNDHVALARVIEQPQQLWPVGFGPGRLFLIDAAALGAVERIQLQVGFLGIGGDACVADLVADLHGAKTPKRCWFCTIPSAPEFCNAFLALSSLFRACGSHGAQTVVIAPMRQDPKTTPGAAALTEEQRQLAMKR